MLFLTFYGPWYHLSDLSHYIYVDIVDVYLSFLLLIN